MCRCGLKAKRKTVKDKSKETYGCEYLGCALFPRGCRFFRWILERKKQKGQKGKAKSFLEGEESEVRQISKEKKRKLAEEKEMKSEIKKIH